MATLRLFSVEAVLADEVGLALAKILPHLPFGKMQVGQLLIVHFPAGEVGPVDPAFFIKEDLAGAVQLFLLPPPQI